MISERPSDGVSIGGAFGFMALVGTFIYLIEPNWKKMQAPIVDIQENRIVLQEKGNPGIQYIDLRPFGSLDYIIDSVSGTPFERSFGRANLDRFGILYRTAVEQNIIGRD